MKKQLKIVIAGIGGVGGYFGGLLAHHYQNSDEIEIVFLARGQHLNAIQNHGLKIIRPDREFIAQPKLATDDVTEIGSADYIIICAKSYDLEKLVEQLKPCINEQTIILSLLNGVDADDRIRLLLPDITLLKGCVYIISRLTSPGIIEKTGINETLFFGLDNIVDERLLLLEKIFKDAEIKATLSTSISKIIWEKFIFISATATATTYFDSNIGRLLAENEPTVKLLLAEVTSLAKAKGIQIDDDIIEKCLTRLRALPYEGTSSMHSDFQKGNAQTEIDSLTKYVVTEADRLNIAVPTYRELMKKF